MLAVFARIPLRMLEGLLASALGESSLTLVTFQNQVSSGSAVPDAAISANFHFLFEVKTARDSLRADQLQRHLKTFPPNPSQQRLFALTPDALMPAAVGQVADPRVSWLSFKDIHDAIDRLLEADDLAGGLERVLLRELQGLFEQEGLLSRDDVVVVAAREAFGFYERYGAYVCQDGRGFRNDVVYMGFYKSNAIQRPLPRIRHREDHVIFSTEGIAELRSEGKTDVAEVVERVLLDEPWRSEQSFQVFVLDTPARPELELPVAVVNDVVDAGGKPVAWTFGQRYARSDRLQTAQYTSDLAEPT
jgi:hypothetical protein